MHNLNKTRVQKQSDFIVESPRLSKVVSNQKSFNKSACKYENNQLLLSFDNALLKIFAYFYVFDS